MSKKINFSGCFKKSIELIEKTGIDYIIVGGVALGVWGRPRVTEDVDIIIFVSEKDIKSIINTAKTFGFEFDKETVLKDAKTGVFKLYYGVYHTDFIVAVSDFAKSALNREIKVRIFDKDVFVVTKEDLLLFKLMSNRAMDLADVENIAKRQSGKLDEDYLRKWAIKLSDEAGDARIYEEVERLLKF